MTESEKQLRKILAERVAILDGAMGTMIQSYKLDEQAFRGGQFAHHGRDLKGCNDLLVHHAARFDHGHSRSISRSRRGYYRDEHFQFDVDFDGRLQSGVDAYELNLAGARAAKKAVDRDAAKDSYAAALCRRRDGADQSDLSNLHRREQRGDARGHV